MKESLGHGGDGLMARLPVLAAQWGTAMGRYFAAFNEQLRLDRGVPWNERRGLVSPERYLAGLAEAVPSLQHDMSEQWARVRTGGYKMNYPKRRDLPPTRFQRRGNFFMTSPHKVQHDAEQLRYLVDTGRLPAAFGALSGAYAQLLAGMQAQQGPAAGAPTETAPQPRFTRSSLVHTRRHPALEIPSFAALEATASVSVLYAMTCDVV